MKLVEVKSTEGRWTIPLQQFETEFERHRMRGFHRTVYSFRSAGGGIVKQHAIVNKAFIDIDNEPMRAVEFLYNYFEPYTKVFVASGGGIHFLLKIEKLPPMYASHSLRSFFSHLEYDLGISFDATSANLKQMRRVPGTLNPKYGNLCRYLDPRTLELSIDPVVTGRKTYRVPLVKRREVTWNPNGRKDIPDSWRKSGTDPFKLDYTTPVSTGHYDRIEVLRDLKQFGVKKEDALEYMEYWLDAETFDHMLGEGVADRIYAGRL